MLDPGRKARKVLLFPSFIFLCACVFCSSISFADEQVSSLSNSRDINEVSMTSRQLSLPDSLKTQIQTLSKNNHLDYVLAMAISERMFALHQVLLPLIQEDSKRKDSDKQYILSNSFTSFMYIMLACSEYALDNDIEDIYFPPIKDLIDLLIQYKLVTDHSSFDQMLSTLKSIHVQKEGYKTRLTLFTPTGKTVEESFSEGIPSPRFVISSVIFKNGASFVISDLLNPMNKEALDEFEKDSQKNFITGGLVLMDHKKANILDFLKKEKAKKHDKAELIRPLLIKGEGFAGRGYVKGLKLPSPSAKMETIYLIPGRDGTPAFVRAHSLFLKPFVAL